MDKQELGKALLAACYLEGDFLLRSGRRSHYYFDKYRFETRPDILGPVAEELVAMLPEGIDRLAGAELGGVPLAAAVALQSGLPYVIVRKESKGYGTDKRIEGPIKEGDHVVLLEDVATTGGAALKAIEALYAAGAGQVSALVVLDRQEGAEEAFRQAGIPCQALFTAETLGIKDKP